MCTGRRVVNTALVLLKQTTFKPVTGLLVKLSWSKGNFQDLYILTEQEISGERMNMVSEQIFSQQYIEKSSIKLTFLLIPTKTLLMSLNRRPQSPCEMNCFSFILNLEIEAKKALKTVGGNTAIGFLLFPGWKLLQRSIVATA